MTDENVDAPTGVNFNAVVEKYIALRDLKAQHKKDYEKKVEDIEAALDRCESFIMTHLQQMGVDSVRTPSGTAYQATRTSATVADWPLTLQWIKDKEQWDMLERRVNKSFVDAFRTEYDDLPPGINWREDRVLNIRRS